MADSSKNLSVHGGRFLVLELKAFFHILKKKRSVTFAYGFMFAFIVLTLVLAFRPSFNPDAPSYTNMFGNSYRSQFSSLFSHFFNPSTTTSPPPSPSHVHDFSGFSNRSNESSIVPDKVQNFNQTQSIPPSSIDEKPIFKQNQTKTESSESKFDKSTPISGKVSILNQTQFINSTNIVKEEPLNHASDASNTTSSSGEIPALHQNQTATLVPKTPISSNQTENSPPKSSVPAKNTTRDAPKTPISSNRTENSPPKSSVPAKNTSRDALKSAAGKSAMSASLSGKLGDNGTKSGEVKKQGKENMVESLMNCDLYYGNWVMDDSYPLYKEGSCSFIDEQFNCVLNGRPDESYQKLKWKPKGCDLPRLNGSHMLEILRGKRLVFVGDSLNRNMWESLVCILKGAATNKKNVYEANGRSYFRGEASYSFIFKDYKTTVEFFVSPFLVREWEMPDKNGKKKETLRLDLVGKSSDHYKDADFIVFNTGHWWTHEKTSLGKDYYQEGSHVYSDLNVLEAFRRALTTWGRWVDANVNPMKSLVFFRGYSASHFSGGQWNSGGQCDNETEPIKNDKYLTEYPPKMNVLEKVFKGIKNPVTYMNVTRMTDYRKDAHPSIYRKQHLSEEERRSPLRFQDCSHWCLPGVPDAWNELLYAELLLKLNKKQKQ